MPQKSDLQLNNEENAIEEIENLLKTFRPSPGKQFYQWAAQESWKGQTKTAKWNISTIFRRKSLRLVGSLGLSILLIGLFLLTSWGQSYAQAIFHYFQFAASSSRTEIVSMTPIPSPDPGYPYNLYSLAISQAQVQAGFDVLSPEELPTDLTFHGAKYDPDLMQVELLYTIDHLAGQTSENGSPDAWIYVKEQITDFEQYWGVCPSGAIHEADINGLSAEIADGITWMTDQPPEPGVKREWVCTADANSGPFAIRWQVNNLRLEITVDQFPGENSLYFTQTDLVDFAKSFK
jgi:hypothetical protein